MIALRPAALAALFSAALFAGALGACRNVADIHDRSSAHAFSAPPSVLLVSIDAFRAGDLDSGLTPQLKRLADEGVRAQWMTPSYPTLTFPNHYTLVTGLRPDRHGVVHNRMRDPALGEFSTRDRAATADARWWGGEPIWVGAEKAGLPTATLFWPGSEAAIGGVRPTRWQPFDDSITIDTRVDTVLGWLGEPARTRPRLVTLYFEALDRASHENGPDSPQARATLARLDAAIGRLRDGLAARDLLDRVNLVIVSDHGMAPVPAGHAIALEDMASAANATPVSAGESVGFAPRPGREAQAEAELLGRHDHYRCWRKQALPAEWHYGSHPRVPPIVCQMDEGWEAQPHDVLARRPQGQTRGAHGFDPALPSMRALFIARGPAFASGRVLPPIDNVDVYPLLARLLGIRAAANDGNPATLAPALLPSAAPVAPDTPTALPAAQH